MKELLVICMFAIGLNSQAQTNFEADFDSTSLEFFVHCNFDSQERYDSLLIEVCDSAGEMQQSLSINLEMPQSGLLGGSSAFYNGLLIPFHGSHLVMDFTSNWSKSLPYGVYIVRFKLRKIEGGIEIFEKQIKK